MKAIDTNVVVRLILRDDSVQYGAAIDLLASDVLIPTTVLLETGWVLASNYRMPRRTIAANLIDLIALPRIRVADAAGLCWALERYADGADLADMIHLVSSAGADMFVTFDKKLAREAAGEPPLAVITL